MLSSAFSLSLGALCLSLAFAPAWGSTASSITGPTPDQYQYTAQCQQSFQRGQFEHAVSCWGEAARRYEKTQHLAARSVALTRLGQAYQALSHYREAVKALHEALQLAERTADLTQRVTILGSLAEVYVGMRDTQEATRHLDAALTQARTLGNAGLVAALLNTHGNMLMSQQHPEAALPVYQESAVFAKEAGSPTLTARALTHAAMAAMQSQQYQASKALLDEAQEHIHRVEPNHEQAYELLNIGLALHQLRPHLADASPALLLRAAQLFTNAANVAEGLEDLQAASYAWGYLGTLYAAEARYPEALQLTRRAMRAAQHVHAPESLYLWQWQTGRLLRATGEVEPARVAYRHAVETLQSIRAEIPRTYGRPPAPFRETLGPLFVERLDLLLRQAAAVPAQSAEALELLQEARHTVKQFKAAELRDYFRDECVDATKTNPIPIENVSPTAAIVYPILLPDRLELLVSLPSQRLKRFAAPVRRDDLTRTVHAFRDALREGSSEPFYKRLANDLYTWLVRPLEPDLASANVQTIVFVPDGPLRLLPLAALHDGAQFLIRKYAVAITPGLDLVDPRPLSGGKLQILAAGVSDAVQGRPPLPDVAMELKNLRHCHNATILHNQAFTLPALEAALRTKDFDVMHIASHGEFASDVERSAVFTYNDQMTLDQLERVVGRVRLRDKPLELLTLSACETALGDDERAALGLAGIAVKAGASSALATLWKVQDKATALLVTAFY